LAVRLGEKAQCFLKLAALTLPLHHFRSPDMKFRFAALLLPLLAHSVSTQAPSDKSSGCTVRANLACGSDSPTIGAKNGR
jgi:hypothetical protein